MPSATNEIGIAFLPKVKVTTTDMLKPSVTGLLSKVAFGNINKIFPLLNFEVLKFTGLNGVSYTNHTDVANEGSVREYIDSDKLMQQKEEGVHPS